jgi:CHAD domain-containing protein
MDLAILISEIRHRTFFNSAQMSTLPKTVYFKVNQDVLAEMPPDKMLPSGYRLDALNGSKELRTYYDTFEWHAFEKGVIVEKRKNILFLADLDTGHEIASVALRGNPPFFFAGSLPAGNAVELLRSCSIIRSFIRQCAVEKLSQPYRILDENDKTIGILKSESLRLADKNSPDPFVQLVSLRPLKGYQKELELIEQSLIREGGLGEGFGFRELFLLIMSAAGTTVQGYSSKILLRLDGEAPIHENARRLLQFSLSIMRVNESGIVKNIDSEFLHDYRVAIRRTRSVLKQLHGIFEPLETERFLNLFKELGKRTNELRDVDVYLLRQASYFSYLPPVLQPSLNIFFSEIERSRSVLHKKFCRYLLSPRYRTFLETWETFLNYPILPDPVHAPNASHSTIKVALKSIKKAWKKVLRHGRLIGPEATDSDLHTLRIDCKKLRYLLEFFCSIFPNKTIAPIIRQLKELQDNLGNFVDLAIQINFLHKHLLSGDNGIGERMLSAATGGLMTALFQAQEETRRKFHKTFNTFDNDETTQLFHELLTITH